MDHKIQNAFYQLVFSHALNMNEMSKSDLLNVVSGRFREQASQSHPDKFGGSTESFIQLKGSYDLIKRWIHDLPQHNFVPEGTHSRYVPAAVTRSDLRSSDPTINHGFSSQGGVASAPRSFSHNNGPRDHSVGIEHRTTSRQRPEHGSEVGFSYSGVPMSSVGNTRTHTNRDWIRKDAVPVGSSSAVPIHSSDLRGPSYTGESHRSEPERGGPHPIAPSRAFGSESAIHRSDGHSPSLSSTKILSSSAPNHAKSGRGPSSGQPAYLSARINTKQPPEDRDVSQDRSNNVSQRVQVNESNRNLQQSHSRQKPDVQPNTVSTAAPKTKVHSPRIRRTPSSSGISGKTQKKSHVEFSTTNSSKNMHTQNSAAPSKTINPAPIRAGRSSTVIHFPEEGIDARPSSHTPGLNDRVPEELPLQHQPPSRQSRVRKMSDDFLDNQEMERSSPRRTDHYQKSLQRSNSHDTLMISRVRIETEIKNNEKLTDNPHSRHPSDHGRRIPAESLKERDHSPKVLSGRSEIRLSSPRRLKENAMDCTNSPSHIRSEGKRSASPRQLKDDKMDTESVRGRSEGKRSPSARHRTPHDDDMDCGSPERSIGKQEHFTLRSDRVKKIDDGRKDKNDDKNTSSVKKVFLTSKEPEDLLWKPSKLSIRAPTPISGPPEPAPSHAKSGSDFPARISIFTFEGHKQIPLLEENPIPKIPIPESSPHSSYYSDMKVQRRSAPRRKRSDAHRSRPHKKSTPATALMHDGEMIHEDRERSTRGRYGNSEKESIRRYDSGLLSVTELLRDKEETRYLGDNDTGMSYDTYYGNGYDYDAGIYANITVPPTCRSLDNLILNKTQELLRQRRVQEAHTRKYAMGELGGIDPSYRKKVKGLTFGNNESREKRKKEKKERRDREEGSRRKTHRRKSKKRID